MEYEKKDGRVVGKLKQRNVDTGMGLERITMVSQGKKNVFETDLFNNEKTKEERIVADHVKAALFMISDGVIPSNTGAGYVLRRLIRRAVRFSKGPLAEEIGKIKKIYGGVYELDDKGEIEKEENKFRQTLQNGLKEFEKGVDPFILATTYGFPIELTLELAKENGRMIDLEDFNKKMTEHQKLSHTSSAGMFKGGLANHNENTIKLHTAHHLLLAGLKVIVDKDIKQRGSNITEERLRMDFLCDHKLTDEEKKKVEIWVNDRIKEGFNVVRREMPLAEAEKIGAEMEFGAKYPEIVSVYFIEDQSGNAISKEFCGGPHVLNTKEIGQIKIQKEEAVAKGIRRIKATIVL
jgi:alanyl-tRNA synthetase